MNHLTIYTSEFITGLAYAVPFTLCIVAFAIHRTNKLLKELS